MVGQKQQNQPKSNSSKIILIVVIVIIVLIVLAGIGVLAGWLVWKAAKVTETPTPAATTSDTTPAATQVSEAEFLTYTNDSNGYSLLYPASWHKSADTTVFSETALFATEPNPVVGGASVTGVEVYIAIAQNPDFLSVEDWVEQNTMDYEGGVGTSQGTIINGEEAIIQTADGPYGPATVVYFGRCSNIYRINYTGDESAYNQNLAIFETMYNSFTFIGPEA